MQRSVSIACFVLVVTSAVAYANPELIRLQTDDKQWVMPGKDYSASRFSTLTQITKDNVKNLRPAWTFSTGTLRGHEGAPLVVGATMYVHTSFPNNVYALDLNGPDVGRIKWKYLPKQDPSVQAVACCDNVNRGLSYADGKIFLSQLDGHLVALDAKTGKEAWKAENADPKVGATMTSAPHVMKDKVIVGVSGGEFGVRGHVTAYDIKTGQQAWRAYSMGPDEEILLADDFNQANPHYGQRNQGISTWQGDQWKTGGGTTWGWYAFDPALNLFYYGSGNPGTWNPSQRPGDNKWSMTIFARNPDTGVAAWAYQMTPHDGWDYDGINESVLTEAQIGGNTVPTLTHFDRNGFAYVLDRRSGKLLAANKFDPTVNWAERIDLQTGRPVVTASKMTQADTNTKNICPAAQGAKNMQPVSYDAKTRLFYAGTNHICMDYQPFTVKYKSGFPYVGATVSMFPADNGDVRGRLIAFDSVTGQTKWTINEPFQVYSGPLTTDGGVIFYGTLDGWFKVADQSTGKVLYQFHTPSGIISNPITYTHNGKQYVALLSGVGGWAAIGLAEGLTQGTEGLGAVGLTHSLGDYTNLGGTLMVFSLE